jgi:hypothetical protein
MKVQAFPQISVETYGYDIQSDQKVSVHLMITIQS